MSTTEQGTKSYARCNTCGIDLPTKDEQRAHMDETFNAAKAENPHAAKSHSTSVVNPPPEEVEANRVRYLIVSAVDDALRRCCEDLDDEVQRGRVTEDQVAEGLRHYDDFAEAWADWVANS